MIGFILTGHGEFAPGLASALELVAGRQEGFKVVPFDVDKAADYLAGLGIERVEKLEFGK